MTLFVHYFGRDIKVAALAAKGVALLCLTDDGRRITIVEAMANDKAEFVRIWRALGGTGTL